MAGNPYRDSYGRFSRKGGRSGRVLGSDRRVLPRSRGGDSRPNLKKVRKSGFFSAEFANGGSAGMKLATSMQSTRKASVKSNNKIIKAQRRKESRNAYAFSR